MNRWNTQTDLLSAGEPLREYQTIDNPDGRAVALLVEIKQRGARRMRGPRA